VALVAVRPLVALVAVAVVLVPTTRAVPVAAGPVV
jgi:hypothetical protein